ARDARAVVRERKNLSKNRALKPRWLVLNKRDLLPATQGEGRARHRARTALSRAAVPDLRGDRRRNESLVRSGYEVFGGARSSGTRARIISRRCWRRAAGRNLRGVGMTGIGMLALEFAALITASLHCADTGRQATLVPCGLVAMDDLLANERVDDRDGLHVD